MKISTLINEIVDEAEYKFCVSFHMCDTISVRIYVNPDEEWQVSLIKPTKNQLDRGEFIAGTLRVADLETRFYTTGTDLLETLKELRQKVEDAEDWDD